MTPRAGLSPPPSASLDKVPHARLPGRRWRWGAAVVLLLAGGLAAAAPDRRSGAPRAAVIAVGSQYDGAPYQPLPSALLDAERMDALLRGAGYQVLPLRREPASSAAGQQPSSHEVSYQELVTLLGQLKAQGHGLLYWSGHCSFTPGPGAGAGLHLELADGRSVPMTEVVRMGHPRITILDCCFAGLGSPFAVAPGKTGPARAPGPSFLLGAGSGVLRASRDPKKPSPFTGALINSLLRARDLDCDGAASLQEASRFTDEELLGARGEEGIDEWTALKGGPGDPVLVRLSSEARASQEARCAPYLTAAQALRSCLAAPPVQRPGWCPELTASLRASLLAVLNGQDARALRDPVWLIYPLGPGAVRAVHALAARLGQAGQPVMLLKEAPLPGPGLAQQRLWLATLLTRLADVLRVEVSADKERLTVHVVAQESGQVLFSAEVSGHRLAPENFRKLQEAVKQTLRGPTVDRLEHGGGLLEPPEVALVARFRGPLPAKIRLRYQGPAGCPSRAIALRRGPGFTVRCQEGQGHCVQVPLGQACRRALARATRLTIEQEQETGHEGKKHK